MYYICSRVRYNIIRRRFDGVVVMMMIIILLQVLSSPLIFAVRYASRPPQNTLLFYIVYCQEQIWISCPPPLLWSSIGTIIVLHCGCWYLNNMLYHYCCFYAYIIFAVVYMAAKIQNPNRYVSIGLEVPSYTGSYLIILIMIPTKMIIPSKSKKIAFYYFKQYHSAHINCRVNGDSPMMTIL